MSIDDVLKSGDPVGLTYDAFISYSHAADDLLAPRLQSALQQFAKPWWQRRAMRVFRDESSLAANPHLWSSITEALDDSAWFVLLLSPDAAQSEWVNREVEYWLEHKDADRILPVVTAGKFSWNGEGSAVPSALRGAFTDEPRWVDLRFADAEERLDLRHAGFRNAVADVASAVRDIPKDELESEEVRQHRRTMRTAWAASVVVVLLAIAATVGALLAINQSREARTQRDEARRLAESEAEARSDATTERDRANQLAEQEAEAREQAEESAAEAEAERAEAERQRSLADARALTLQADKNIEVDPELSMLLALAAMRRFESSGAEIPADTVTVLREAIAADRIVARYPSGDSVWVNPDGSLLVAASESGDVEIREMQTGIVVRTVPPPPGLLLGFGSAPNGLEPVGAFRHDGLNHLYTLDLVSASWQADLGAPPPASTSSIAVSQDGSRLALRTDATVEVRDVASGDVMYREASANGTGMAFWDVGRLAFVVDTGETLELRVVEPSTGTTLQAIGGITFVPLFLAVSPDGRYAALSTQTQVGVVDLEEGRELWAADDLDRMNTPVWHAGSDEFYVGGEGDIKRIDTLSGRVLEEIAGNRGGSFSLQSIPGTDLVASAGLSDGWVVYLDVSDGAGSEVGFASTPVFGPFHVAPVGTKQRLLVGAGNHFAEVDTSTGEVLNEQRPPDDVTNVFAFPIFSRTGEYWAVTNDDGSSHLWWAANESPLYTAPAGWSIRGVSDDGSYVVISLDLERVVLVSVADGATVDLGPSGLVFMADFSADGSMVVINIQEDEPYAAIFSVPDGAPLARFGGADWETFWGLWIEFTPDGGSIILGTANGEIMALDVDRLLDGAHVSEALRYRLPAHSNLILPGAISLDSTLMASTAFEERVQLRDVVTGALLGELGTSEKSGVAFDATSTRLYVAEGFEIRMYTLDTHDLRQIALDRLTRGLAADECVEYLIDPCE